MKLACDFDSVYVDLEEARLFLPFIGGEAARIEVCALAAKRCLGLDLDAIVDPWRAAESVEVEVRGAAYLGSFATELSAQVLETGAQDWSAGTVLHNGKALVVLNPTHDVRRQRATLAEELAHLVMGHPPSELHPTYGFRTFDRGIEDEAFGVGGAMIAPYSDLFSLVNQGASEDAVAEHFGVSRPFAKYRINRTGLRKVYRKRRTQPA